MSDDLGDFRRTRSRSRVVDDANPSALSQVKTRRQVLHAIWKGATVKSFRHSSGACYRSVSIGHHVCYGWLRISSGRDDITTIDLRRATTRLSYSSNNGSQGGQAVISWNTSTYRKDKTDNRWAHFVFKSRHDLRGLRSLYKHLTRSEHDGVSKSEKEMNSLLKHLRRSRTMSKTFRHLSESASGYGSVGSGSEEDDSHTRDSDSSEPESSVADENQDEERGSDGSEISEIETTEDEAGVTDFYESESGESTQDSSLIQENQTDMSPTPTRSLRNSIMATSTASSLGEKRSRMVILKIGTEMPSTVIANNQAALSLCLAEANQSPSVLLHRQQQSEVPTNSPKRSPEVAIDGLHRSEMFPAITQTYPIEISTSMSPTNPATRPPETAVTRQPLPDLDAISTLDFNSTCKELERDFELQEGARIRNIRRSFYQDRLTEANAELARSEMATKEAKATIISEKEKWESAMQKSRAAQRKLSELEYNDRDEHTK